MQPFILINDSTGEAELSLSCEAGTVLVYRNPCHSLENRRMVVATAVSKSRSFANLVALLAPR
jgi:hypothetical protein